jgi:uncharacterized protein YbjT (DUF2867 family)
LPPALFQPIASEDVAAAMVDFTLGAPVNGTVEIAGPERISLAKLVQRYLSAIHDPRKVTADVQARYFGIEVNDQSLTPGSKPWIGSTNLDVWLSQSTPQKSAN